ncbi:MULTISPECIES: hypothetical protein [unclassified Streptomyces]|uniref:hypothetical protein n=1 Tax=unclassified Streptomyces TaxID=2593676 RepID=UPI00365399AE
MTHTPELQAEIIIRIITGKYTPQDITQVVANFHQWLAEEWDGKEARSVAHCLHALADAADGAWEAQSQRDQFAHTWFFALGCPRPVDYDSLLFEANAYWHEASRFSGGPHGLAKLIRALRGQPE